MIEHARGHKVCVDEAGEGRKMKRSADETRNRNQNDVTEPTTNRS